MTRLRTILGATVLAAAVILATPAAALASTIYPPSGSCTTSPTSMTSGATTTLACDAETFSPGEDVTITVTGEGGSAAVIGMVRFAPSTASGNTVARSDGSLSGIKIAFPSSARGTYNIAAISATSAGGTAAITVTNADGSLPSTGMDSGTLTGLFIGGGILLVGGAALAIVAVVRRQRDSR